MNPNQIETAAQDLVSKGEMFTAFDITKTLKGVKHNDVNTEVKNLFSGGLFVGYTRTSQVVGANGATAWVYHPLAADVSQYGQPAVASPTPLVTAAQAMALISPTTP